jgi:hypothetical protein
MPMAASGLKPAIPELIIFYRSDFVPLHETN